MTFFSPKKLFYRSSYLSFFLKGGRGKLRKQNYNMFYFCVSHTAWSYFSFLFLSKQCTFQIWQKRQKGKRVELHQANFYWWQKYGARWTAHLPRVQLTVHRRTASISMKQASSPISVFVLILPRAWRCWGNQPWAGSTFCLLAHYLSVNTLDAWHSYANCDRNKSPGYRISPEVFPKLDTC